MIDPLKIAQECGATITPLVKSPHGFPQVIHFHSEEELTAFTHRVIEEAAKLLDKLHDAQVHSMTSHNYYRRGASAIRSLKDSK